MQCSQAYDLMGSWIDEEIDPGDRTALEAHLSDCKSCRADSEALRTQDAQLRRMFEPRRIAAARVAEVVVERLRQKSASQPHLRRQWFRTWIAPLLGVAVGFLLAVLVFEPWKSAGPEESTATREPNGTVPSGPETPVVPTAASLVVSTGDVEVRRSDSAEWVAVASLPSFNCPNASSVRTGPDVRCELQTPDGCVIRLDAQSEVALLSADRVEIKQGKVWCNSPPNAPFTVLAAHAPSANSKSPTEPSSMLAANACLMTCVQNDGAVRVMSAEGDVQVQCASDRQVLKRGENISIVGGKLIRTGDNADPLLDASWIHSLLMKKGHADPELNTRVDMLLARVGQSKMSYLYEQEIRSLGEYGALPLLRYVQSPISKSDGQQRHPAMRILADIAPPWAIGDLIGVLSDDDAEIRVHAAVALARLTGQTMGRSPEQWQEPAESCRETCAKWNEWWQGNRSRFPTPVPVNSIPAGLKKADSRPWPGERPV